ncbi:MAG: hypothetical protein KF773_05855 [Deltaproteobacteria bacterium]|nr:hypothetical protein [Deltaproteobacteria bacterium]
MGARSSWLTLVVCAACADPTYDPRPPIIHARFDPDAKSIPMPNDAVRDAERGVLDLPNDTPKDLAKLTDAEKEFYAYLETLDGWSTLMSARVEMTGAIDPATVNHETVQVWHWGTTPARLDDVRVHVSDDGLVLTIDPPRTGWIRGDRYGVVLRGGARGVGGAHGERVECDAAFYFLRQKEALDTPEHERAFPGDTAAERRDNAHKLEVIRRDIAPLFEHFEARGLPREEVAALWAFTTTTRTELAMDKASQRMPLPIDLILDPASGHVDLPGVPWDRPFETEAKKRLAEYQGFGLSSSLLFELTAPVDPATIDASNVHLYRLGAGKAPQQELVDVKLLPDRMGIVVTPKAGRLAEATTYVVVVDRDVRDGKGKEVVAMPAGHFLQAHAPVFDGAASLVAGVDAIDAHKLENARTQIASALDQLGRDRILAAWPFTTMEVKRPVLEARTSAERLGISPQPTMTDRKSPAGAIADFALAIGALTSLSDVFYGTIPSPYFLDPMTRAWRSDGDHRVEDVAFTLTVPKNPKPGPMPVVIFGHGLVTERRFVLAVAGALAGKGYAAISIDFPFHGTRTYCATGGPISVVNPQTGQLTSLNPCASGSTCNAVGKCVDSTGQGNHLAKWPILDMPVASGAVFTEVDHIASTKDHFLQALVDLGSLDRSLRVGDWSSMLGRAVDTSQIFYAGQSLGGITGALFLGTSPEIPRAVLNVPGADLIRMFDDSTFFSAQLDALFTRERVDRTTYEGFRLLAVASWIMDAIDPLHLGPETGDRALMLQMATLDFIIPNASTKKLGQVTGAPRRDYIAEHAFITIPLEPEYLRGCNDMARFLAGELAP